LSKRVLAAFLVTLFIIATFATVAEVQAHYTLGQQGVQGVPSSPVPTPGTYGSTVDTYLGGHVAGHLAYVRPGRLYEYPKDQLPNYYSPEGAIITETAGGLTFYLNFTVADQRVGAPSSYACVNIVREDGNWLYIAIPPEFGVPEGFEDKTEAYVWTSITNDYATIKTGKFAGDHGLAPGWWYVAISSYTTPGHEDKGWLYTAGEDPYPDRQIRGGWADGLYWVSVGGLTAPSIAGKYFFKVFYTDPDWPATPWETYISIPPENYPTLVVKGELDPGYISGRVLYGGSYYYGYYYGDPIWKPGRVIAEGEAIDPVTNEPTGRRVMGWGYFNASANGFYEIEGLAPGIYTLTAEAAGFPPVTLATEITVKRGQSIHGINIYVFPGAKIKLKVNSKCPTGRIEFPDWVCMGSAEDPTSIAALLGRNGYPEARYKVDLYDEEGNWVAVAKDYWNIAVPPGNESFTVYFGDLTSYEGAEVVWDGHVPDDSAHSISGVSAGVYMAKISVFGYVQLEDYQVVVPSAQYTGEIYREVDIFQGGKFTATVHFHNQEMPSAEEPPVIAGDLIIEAFDAEENLRAWNYTHNDGTMANVQVDVIGDPFAYYGMAAGTYSIKVWYPGYAQQEFPMHTLSLCVWNSLSFHLVKGANITVTVYSRDWQSPAQVLPWLHPPSRIRVYFYNSAGDAVGYVNGNQGTLALEPDREHFYYFGDTYGIGDYITDGLYPSGLPTDVYSIKAFTVGYIQRMVPEVWAQKASSTGDIPLYLFAGASIFITVNFKLEELLAPLPPDNWSYYFRINVFDEEGMLAAANITSVPQHTDPAQAPGYEGVVVWTFEVVGFNGFDTPGRMGLVFPPTAWEEGFVPSKAFGYFEPSTWEKHLDYGIDAGTYTLEVIDETNGYVQTATVAVTVSLMGSATVFLDMHKMASIGGTIYQRNYMGDFVRASWYTVELSGSPAATTSTKDGSFSFNVPAGTYTLKAYLAAPDQTDAVVLQERTVVVTWGASAGGQDFYMEEGGVPIPEFPAAGVLMLISALAASLYLLRWRKQAIVPMP